MADKKNCDNCGKAADELFVGVREPAREFCKKCYEDTYGKAGKAVEAEVKGEVVSEKV